MIAIFSLFQRVEIRASDALVHAVARRSMSLVCRRLRADTMAMNVAELRGYVRARAAPAVRAQLLQSIAAHRLPAKRVDALIAESLERTVHLLVQELLAPPVIAIPAPHIRLRAAA